MPVFLQKLRLQNLGVTKRQDNSILYSKDVIRV